MLPIFIVALIVTVVYRITIVAVIVTVTVTVTIAVLFVFSIAGRPLFAAYPGAVPLLAVRTIVVVLFAAAFAMLAALLTGGTVFLIGR